MGMNYRFSQSPGPIGIFDSGYGGLTIYQEIQRLMPEYDYLYLGDNARTPYGTRSFDVVSEFTRQSVCYLFQAGCQLVVLACNTASAKALRSIQQVDLPQMDPRRRVLGIIRPTVENIGNITKSNHVGVLATDGTIKSMSYPLEIRKLYYFIKKQIDNLLGRDPLIDTIILGCTHYPLLIEKIEKYVPAGVKVVTQGKAVAESLKDYLDRHPEIEGLCTRGAHSCFCTTESEEKFRERASVFLHQPVKATTVII